MNSKQKVARMIPRHQGQLNLFSDFEKIDEEPMVKFSSTTAKVLSFKKAVQDREADKVSDILRFVREDVEHLRVK